MRKGALGFRFFTSLFAVLIYFSLGMYFLFFGKEINTFAFPFGILLIVYALFRAWRLWGEIKEEKNEPLT